MGSLGKGIASGGGMDNYYGATHTNSVGNPDCSGEGRGWTYSDGSGHRDCDGFGSGNITVRSGKGHSYGYGDNYCSGYGYHD